jgi:hypothetical protein
MSVIGADFTNYGKRASGKVVGEIGDVSPSTRRDKTQQHAWGDGRDQQMPELRREGLRQFAGCFP